MQEEQLWLHRTVTYHAEVQVARDELLDDEEYSDILDDITEEIETKYGHITSIAIPRPRTPQDTVSHHQAYSSLPDHATNMCNGC